MKPYFAKYLPVEGEIKDMMIHPKNHPEPMSVKGLPAPPIAYSKNGWIPVKLFLCSRDIQVGDKIRSTKDDIEYICNKGNLAACEIMGVRDTLYKVIGEISPDATWVKEGDEFDEDQVRISELPMCPKCGSPRGNEGFCPYEEDCEGDNQRIIAQILGPCGHFH